jgi:hypothetical protein
MAEIEFNEKDPVINTDLEKVVKEDTPVKEWLINYVGEKTNPENGEVTVGMIVETLAEEFPDFLLVLAEENFIRGYEQALTDVEVGRSLVNTEDLITNE